MENQVNEKRGLKELIKKVPGAKALYYLIRVNCLKVLARISPRVFYMVRMRSGMMKRWPNLKNPRYFAEKNIWLILNWRHPLKTLCADKYLVRDYVAKHGCEDVLIPLIGVWEKVEDIDCDKLPDKFALKCNVGCGGNVICKDKKSLDWAAAKKKLKTYMQEDFGKYSGELHYSGAKPCLICEQLLENDGYEMLVDYKTHWLSGKFYFCEVILDRKFGLHTPVRDQYYDANWNRLRGVLRDKKLDSETSVVERPKSFEKMLEVGAKLSQAFPYVRIDFYDINGRPYLGEMTFTPAGGIEDEWTDRVQLEMGDMIILPEPVSV